MAPVAVVMAESSHESRNRVKHILIFIFKQGLCSVNFAGNVPGMDYITKLLANRKRDKTIRRLRLRGWTLQRIADHVGVTPQRVHQILDK